MLFLQFMQFGICLLSLIPARKEASSTSEMVTQLVFGDCYTVIENGENWIKIKIEFDGYECWISLKQHTRINETTFLSLKKEVPFYSNELVQVLNAKKSNLRFPITLGATLPFYKNNNCNFESFEFEFDGQVIQPTLKSKAESIISTAYLFINAPYLWGGKSPFGIDCSGFTQTTYKLNGYKLPRDASEQVELGTPLSFVEEAEAGDLAFFDNEEGKIVHVGILLNNEQIIHASGCVKIDKFDHYGIFSSETKKYSHTLRVIKRIL